MTSKILIDAEVSMTQEDFLLVKKAADLVKMSIGDFIISTTRHKAIEVLPRTDLEVLEFDRLSAKENPSNTGPLERVNQENECEQTGEDRLI